MKIIKIEANSLLDLLGRVKWGLPVLTKCCRVRNFSLYCLWYVLLYILYQKISSILWRPKREKKTASSCHRHKKDIRVEIMINIMLPFFKEKLWSTTFKDKGQGDGEENLISPQLLQSFPHHINSSVVLLFLSFFITYYFLSAQ